jgi:hypothetical protein
MKLELKYLAPYLPYGLKITDGKNDTFSTLELKPQMLGVIEDVNQFYRWFVSKDFKPILRPLSDLTKEIEGENEISELHRLSSYSHEVFNKLVENKLDPYFLEYWIFEILIKNHFDIFGLIPAGLAIDINTLN